MATATCSECDAVADRPTQEAADAWVERHTRREHPAPAAEPVAEDSEPAESEE